MAATSELTSRTRFQYQPGFPRSRRIPVRHQLRQGHVRTLDNPRQPADNTVTTSGRSSNTMNVPIASQEPRNRTMLRRCVDSVVTGSDPYAVPEREIRTWANQIASTRCIDAESHDHPDQEASRVGCGVCDVQSELGPLHPARRASRAYRYAKARRSGGEACATWMVTSRLP